MSETAREDGRHSKELANEIKKFKITQASQNQNVKRKFNDRKKWMTKLTNSIKQLQQKVALLEQSVLAQDTPEAIEEEKKDSS